MTRLTRAAALTCSGDPYRTAVWIECYKKFVQPEVDKLYVCINADTRQDILDYCAEKFEEVGAVLVTPEPGASLRKFLPFGNGPRTALKHLYEAVQEDLVFSFEDDFYMLQAGNCNKWFDMIENQNYDAVASFRCCASTGIRDKTIQRFGLLGDLKSWPFFCQVPLVIKTTDLLKVKDREYGSWGCKRGTHLPELGWTVDEDWACGDVMTWASIQLYAAGLRNFEVIRQWMWIECMIYKNWTPPWIHTSGGCSMYVGYLINPTGGVIGLEPGMNSAGPDVFPILRPLDGYHLRDVRESMQAFWRVAYKHFPIPSSHPASKFNLEFEEALNWADTHLLMTSGEVAMRPSVVARQQDFYESVLGPILI